MLIPEYHHYVSIPRSRILRPEWAWLTLGFVAGLFASAIVDVILILMFPC